MKIIMHSSVSLDGSLLGFEVDMAAHYKIAGSFKADIHLVGSSTAAAGLRRFYRRLPAEQEKDFAKPKTNAKRPLWVIPDTSGKLRGKLHVLRQSGYCRDVVVLTSSTTPKGYLRYLTERNYDWHYTGKKPLNYSHALDVLANEYKARTILTDSGRTLNGILLNAGLVNEISLLVHPVIAGGKRFPLFADVRTDLRLKLLKNKSLGGKTWLLFKIEKTSAKKQS